MKRKKILIFLTSLLICSLALTSSGLAKPSEEKSNDRFLDFVFHIENAAATDLIDPRLTPPWATMGSEGLRNVFYYREYNLFPIFNNYIQVGTSQTPILPEDYECTYTVIWTYDDPILGTGRGVYKVYETITLPNGYIQMMSKETLEFTIEGGLPNFSGGGTFIGHGEIDGQKIQMMGVREAAFVLGIGFVIENTGTIQFLDNES